MERMEKKGIKIMSGRGECFDIGGYSVRKTLARLHDKEGLYTCTPGQAFEKTTEFSTMQGIVFTPATKNFIGKTFKDEDYKGSMVVGVEKLIWVWNVVEEWWSIKWFMFRLMLINLLRVKISDYQIFSWKYHGLCLLSYLSFVSFAKSRCKLVLCSSPRYSFFCHILLKRMWPGITLSSLFHCKIIFILAGTK